MATRARQAVRGWGPYPTDAESKSISVVAVASRSTGSKSLAHGPAPLVSGDAALPHGAERLDERVDARRVELPARQPAELLDRLVETSRRTIRARLGHRDERICGRDDSRAERC